MRNPNGFGTVYKMHGNRRKPFIASVTIPLEDGRKTRKAIGYYATRREALAALSEYHNQPYDLSAREVTVKEFFDKWLAWRETRGKGIQATATYKSNFLNHCKPLFNKRFLDVQSIQIQQLVDAAPSPIIAERIKTTWGMLYKYAALTGITTANAAAIVERPTRPKSTIHKPFTDDEIKSLWKTKDNPIARLALIYIYTGMRPSELLNIKREDVHIKERYMIGGMKTAAGRGRTIPIAKKILPFIKELYASGDEYIYPLRRYERLREKWIACPLDVIQNHLPHDGRHTCATLLDNARIAKRTMQLILGHAGKDVEESVYTHKTLAQIIEAIDKI